MALIVDGIHVDKAVQAIKAHRMASISLSETTSNNDHLCGRRSTANIFYPAENSLLIR